MGLKLDIFSASHEACYTVRGILKAGKCQVIEVEFFSERASRNQFPFPEDLLFVSVPQVVLGKGKNINKKTMNQKILPPFYPDA